MGSGADKDRNGVSSVRNAGLKLLPAGGLGHRFKGRPGGLRYVGRKRPIQSAGRRRAILGRTTAVPVWASVLVSTNAGMPYSKTAGDLSSPQFSRSPGPAP